MDFPRMSFLTILLTVLAFEISSASSKNEVIFFETFDESYEGRWIKSEASEYEGVWKHAAGESTGDFGLLVSEKNQKYGIATSLPQKIDPAAGPLVLQYEVRLQNGLECGGAYLKFLMPQEAGWTPNLFKDDSPYSIMFGPDKCGATNKVHFIFRHKHPKTGEYVEHHLNNPPVPAGDKLTHVYTAVVLPNNTVRILIDGVEKKSANLLSDDFTPSVIPPKTIPDKEDKKPEDWDDRKKIPDPDATKPDDWDEEAPREIEDAEATKPEGWLDDEPLEIDDPEASKPDDWDDAEDGEWEPSKVPNPKCNEAPGCGEWKRPMKRNPAFKGKWRAPMVDNPKYQGVWAPRQIDNPDYFELERPNLEPVAAVGIEIWTISDGILFDNILVSSDEAVAAEYRESQWKAKHAKEEAADKEKREREKAEAKKKEPKKTLKERVFDILYKVPEIPALKSYKLQIFELLEKAEDYASVVVGVVFALPILLLLGLLSCCLGGGKTRVQSDVGRAKKEDISSPDDKVPEGEVVAAEPEEVEEAKEEVEETQGEIVEEKKETVGRVTRRTRRDS